MRETQNGGNLFLQWWRLVIITEILQIVYDNIADIRISAFKAIGHQKAESGKVVVANNGHLGMN